MKFADATGLELRSKREELARRIDELHVKIAAWERDPRVAAGGPRRARRQSSRTLEAQRDALDTKPPPAKGSFFRYSGEGDARVALGKDPAIEADLLAYYKAVNDHNRVAFADRVPPPPRAGPGERTWASRCARPATRRRARSGTTRATRARTRPSRRSSRSSTSSASAATSPATSSPAGAPSRTWTKLQNVQCEVCHGPGSQHAANPADRTTHRREAAAVERASQCHHSPHVEEFDPVAKMKECSAPGTACR